MACANSMTVSTSAAQDGVKYIEQYADKVLDFSSHYGSEGSVSYTAYNLTGKPSKFPDYGDFPQTFVMRTYGRWWDEAPSGTKKFMPQTFGSIDGRDYVDLYFEEPVYPRKVSIFETYNPGSVVRIWALSTIGSWHTLWEGEPQLIGHTPRKFSPVEKAFNFMSKIIKLEFDQSQHDYYPEIDAVLLVGTREPIGFYKDDDLSHDNSLMQQILSLKINEIPQVDLSSNFSSFLQDEFPKILKDSGENSSSMLNMPDDPFRALPHETMIKIFGYLDLKSLCRCSQVNSHFHNASMDPFLYIEISLKPYWYCVSDKALTSLQSRFNFIQKLDLSWCGNYMKINPDTFVEFIENCGGSLTSLRLNCCKFINNACLKKISEVCKNLRGSCDSISNLDEVAVTISRHNKELISIDFWKGSSLTTIGLQALSQCKMLQEVDFGWCFGIGVPGESLRNLASNCPHLRKVFLAAVRGVSDLDISAFLQYCPEIQQLDLLGAWELTPDMCLQLLMHCKKLRLLDVSFCDKIENSDIAHWKKIFPHVSLKKSFQLRRQDHGQNL
ncbi:F-box/LRR-repeat protein 4 isoform X2 [Ischnura elegans]|uniref:F-box/LRR-repeat protein 4 isoform X2 n=1 Tax=Ischnura elegans TaxID=197161 RepID=UPI001ED88B1A|nr:F-box/LRR-repeat protein 4 isoform X2 [Ischnura elegans]